MRKINLVEYCLQYEDSDLLDYLKEVLEQMKKTAEHGLKTEGVLPGKLKLQRKAKTFFEQYEKTNDTDILSFAIALATAEENGAGGIVVTAPTCGSCGVVPGTILPELYYGRATDEELIESLVVAGLIGNKILERYQRPLLILKDYGDTYSGSMRAIGLKDFRQICEDSGLAEAKGHESASGITIKKCDFEKFCEYIEKELSQVDFSVEVDIDIKINVNDITRSLVDKIKSIDRVSGTGFKPIKCLVEGMTEIPAYAFINCTSLGVMTLPSTITSIGTHAFYNCKGLRMLDMNENLKSIGSYAFTGCDGLLSLLLNEGLESISANAFASASFCSLYCSTVR